MTKMERERRRREWNQTELAFHSRLAQADISRIERRRVIPTPTYLERIARALGLLPEEVLEEVPAEEFERAS